MDHTHCFTSTGELNPNLANIQLVKDSALYGLFPGFVPWVRQAAVETAIARLGQLEEDAVAEVIAAVPPEWEVDGRTRQAWQEMICRRASFVRETIMAPIKKVCWPDQFWDTQA